MCSIEDHVTLLRKLIVGEIELKNIVERLKSSGKDTNTDGDETMVKNGVTISKFSFEALGLGPDGC